MAKIDHSRAKTRDQQRKSERASTTREIANKFAHDRAAVLTGMGKGRFSKAADQFMGAEPVRRIDPNSPEGRAIAAKFTQ